MFRGSWSAGLVAVALAVLSGLAALPGPGAADDKPPTKEAAPVDATTLRHKVLCGYQGWFRCPGDPAGVGWRHWSRDAHKITPDTLTFEMWPDMAEYDDDERYPAPGFALPGGRPATLFSSANPKTVDRHFEWMRKYGIDGVLLQRFLVDLKEPSADRVLANVRASAGRTGRTFALAYDLTGCPKEKAFDLLVADWKRLLDEEKLTRDGRYLHQGGKPVLFVFGFYSDRFGPDLAHRLIDFLKGDPRYGVTLVGGCQWDWRTERDSEWARAFRRLDVISPWNVGNVATEGGRKYAATGSWKEDLEEARKAGAGYLPVIYPGFGWSNLKGEKAAEDEVPRLGGEFFWRQFSAAAELGVEMAYVAMFDEVDEGTAVFKVGGEPRPGRFLTYEGLPSDWYLRLTGEGTRLIRGERKNQKALPIEP